MDIYLKNQVGKIKKCKKGHNNIKDVINTKNSIQIIMLF